ncbi:MAG: ATP synthase F1 subunit delta [Kiritimatiellae bacterium]|jgi:F-type H+-transporting ATPase subunit delta|nr:ATP synthase F1 subunit delta [Kiritimatiellia bacterium]
MSGPAISVRYATALYQVADEMGTLDAVTEDMLFMNNLMNEAPEIKQYCQKTRKINSQVLSFIEIAFLPYVSKHTGSMIDTAVRNGRLTALPLIPDAFSNIANEKSGTAMAFLETAHEPTDDLIVLIKERMQLKTNKNIKLEHTVNPDLLGGFKVWCEGRMIDNSVAGRLIRMKRLLRSI